MRQEYKPPVYGRNDMHGRPVAFTQAAPAIAQYLENVQWGPAQNLCRQLPQATRDHLQARKRKSETLQFEDGPITEAELQSTIHKMSRGKAPGPDGIMTDAIRDLDDTNRGELLKLMNAWWEKGELPTHLNDAYVASLYKKGDPRDQANYRPISLLNILYKVIAAIVKVRLEATLEQTLMSTQFGFRKKQKYSTSSLCCEEGPRLR